MAPIVDIFRFLMKSCRHKCSHVIRFYFDFPFCLCGLQGFVELSSDGGLEILD